MLTKDNTLIIIPPAGLYPQKLFDSITKLGYMVCPSMRGNDNFFCRAFRSIFMKYDMKSQVFLYGRWNKENLNKYENILIFHDKYSYPIIRVLQNKLKYTGMIYLYYMDPMETDGAKDCNTICVKPNEHFQIYSFEKKDCEKYGYQYNSLFFFKEDAKIVDEYWTDVFFIGTDKGRLKDILYSQKILHEAGIHTYMHVCMYGNKPSGYGREIHYSYKPKIPYDELMEKLYHTRCVLDIVPEGQKEITLRVYEALFCHKKVITNNVNIKKYGFYNSRNIFVIGEDAIDDIRDFVYSNFDSSEIDEEIENMDFERWIRRFL